MTRRRTGSAPVEFSTTPFRPRWRGGCLVHIQRIVVGEGDDVSGSHRVSARRNSARRDFAHDWGAVQVHQDQIARRQPQ